MIGKSTHYISVGRIGADSGNTPFPEEYIWFDFGFPVTPDNFGFDVYDVSIWNQFFADSGANFTAVNVLGSRVALAGNLDIITLLNISGFGLIAADISLLVNLTQLYADHNNFESPDGSISNPILPNDLSKITHIKMDYNPLNIAYGLYLYGFTSLVSVSLSNCQISGFIEVSGSPDLKYLNVSYNNIDNLILSGCDELEVLSCGSNQLTSIDFASVPKLKELECENQPTLGAMDFTLLPKLQILSIANTNRTDADLDFSGCPELVVITMSQNPGIVSPSAIYGLNFRVNTTISMAACSLTEAFLVGLMEWLRDNEVPFQSITAFYANNHNFANQLYYLSDAYSLRFAAGLGLRSMQLNPNPTPYLRLYFSGTSHLTTLGITNPLDPAQWRAGLEAHHGSPITTGIVSVANLGNIYTFQGTFEDADIFDFHSLGLTSIELPYTAINLQTLDVSDNNMSGVALSLPRVVCDFNFKDCDMNAAEIGSWLSALVTIGITGATIDMSGTNATPDAGGLTNKATLIAAGNTVITN